MYVLWVVIAILVVVVIAGVVLAAMRQRTSRLRGRFGREYEQTVQARGGDRLAAERELSGRMSRRKKLEIVPLSEPARQRYVAEWQQVQAQFVDAPSESLAAANALVDRVMQERGYPMGEFDQRAADISVDHADVVDHYRAAHAVSVADASGGSNTEQQRQAMVHYRALFEELLRPSAGETQTPAQEQAPQYAASNFGGGAAAPPPPPPSTGAADRRNVG